MSIEVDPIKWVIPRFLPEGFTVLAAVPKAGKSTLGLDWAVGVAQEEVLLGLPPYKAVLGRTLYIALDDKAVNRAQERLSKRTKSKGMPELLTISDNWPRSNEGGIDKLKRFMDASPQQVQVVVIDVLQKFLPYYKEDASAYQKLQEHLPPLRELAQEYHIALVGLMHMNKDGGNSPDWTSGIYGNIAVQGEADNILGLILDKDDKRVLKTRGRDVEVGTFDTLYDKETERVTVKPNHYEMDDIREKILRREYSAKDSPVKQRVIAVLSILPGCSDMSSGEVTQAMTEDLQAKPSTVRGSLSELRIAKLIDIQHYKETGRYRLPDCGTATMPPPTTNDDEQDIPAIDYDDDDVD